MSKGIGIGSRWPSSFTGHSTGVKHSFWRGKREITFERVARVNNFRFDKFYFKLDDYDAGVNIKPTGDALIIAPPFVCDKRDIDEIIEKMRLGISSHIKS